jgi:catechol 2,3-dioxygenase-like lactoylglutathione lyase family enzyme
MMNSQIRPQRTNTILYCLNFTETVQFYKVQLGLPVTFANDWFVEFQLAGSSFLSIANAARATVSAVEGQGVTLALQVEDVCEVRDDLQSRGIQTTPLQHKWGGKVMYCLDPEGHRLEFWQADIGTADMLT